MRNKATHIDSEAYLRKVRLCRCVSCGAGRGVEAAHLRFADARHDKEEAGIGRKPSDHHTLPLCASCHRTSDRAQHNSNEREWWTLRRIDDPIALAEELYALRDDLRNMGDLIALTIIMGHSKCSRMAQLLRD